MRRAATHAIQMGLYYHFHYFWFRMPEFQLKKKNRVSICNIEFMYLLQVYHTSDTDPETTIALQEKLAGNHNCVARITDNC